MIKVKVTSKTSCTPSSSPVILEITISGHSGYAEEGSDIVCAGVSSVFNVVINNVEQSNYDIKVSKSGFGAIKCLTIPSNQDNFLMNCFIKYIKELTNKYSKYVLFEETNTEE